jgi:hypothetical protein
MRIKIKFVAVGVAAIAASTLAIGSASASAYGTRAAERALGSASLPTPVATPHMKTPSASPLIKPMTLNQPYDGTDPAATGCANTASNASVTQTPFGTLILRWSSGCKTNWGKFTPNGSADLTSVWVYRQADNQYCGDQSGNGCNAAWWTAPAAPYSNQLYGCNYSTRAEVEVWDNGNPQYFYTNYVGGC